MRGARSLTDAGPVRLLHRPSLAPSELALEVVARRLLVAEVAEGPALRALRVRLLVVASCARAARRRRDARGAACHARFARLVGSVEGVAGVAVRRRVALVDARRVASRAPRVARCSEIRAPVQRGFGAQLDGLTTRPDAFHAPKNASQNIGADFSRSLFEGVQDYLCSL